MGDLNCDLLSNNTSDRQLRSACELFQLNQLIDGPTRITQHSRTLIDVVLTNTPDRIVQSGVIHIVISDHSLIYAVRKVAVPTNNKHNITFRSFKNFDENDFKRELESLPWDGFSILMNPNDMWLKWKELFLSVANKHAPLKRKRLRNKSSPWLTIQLREIDE